MTTTAYAPRHRHPDVDHVLDMFDPSDPRDAYEVEEVTEVLRALPLDPDALGDGGVSDWSLSILFALAGRGDEDAYAYLAPRIEVAALRILADLGYPGEAFQGA